MGLLRALSSLLTRLIRLVADVLRLTTHGSPHEFRSLIQPGIATARRSDVGRAGLTVHRGRGCVCHRMALAGVGGVLCRRPSYTVNPHPRSVVALDALCRVGIDQKTRRLSLLNRAGLKAPLHRVYADDP